jgi:hypothetical protein
MIWRIAHAFLATILFTCLQVGCARAEIYIATISGEVVSGYDQTGLFGTPGALTEQPFVARFKYNVNVGIEDREPSSLSPAVPGTSDLIEGGTFVGAPSPIIEIEMVLGSKQQTFKPTSGAFIAASTSWTNPVTGLLQNFFEAYGVTDTTDAHFDVYNQLELWGWVDPGITDVRQIGVYNMGLADPHAVEHLSLYKYDYASGTTLINTYADLFPQTLTITAMPEPATWWAMIVGFGLIGLRMRRGHQRAMRRA